MIIISITITTHFSFQMNSKFLTYDEHKIGETFQFYLFGAVCRFEMSVKSIDND